MFANQVISFTQICDVTPVWRGSTGLNCVIRKSRPRHVTDHKINRLLFFWRTEPLHKQNCCSEIAARQSPREIEGRGCMGGEGKEDWRWWKCEPYILLRRFTISENLSKAEKQWKMLYEIIHFTNITLIYFSLWYIYTLYSHSIFSNRAFSVKYNGRHLLDALTTCGLNTNLLCNIAECVIYLNSRGNIWGIISMPSIWIS